MQRDGSVLRRVILTLVVRKAQIGTAQNGSSDGPRTDFKVSPFKIVLNFLFRCPLLSSFFFFFLVGERNPAFIRFSKEITIPPNLRIIDLETRLFFLS